jgi:hypothetical protein
MGLPVTAAERNQIRQWISDKVRERTGTAACPLGRADEYGYDRGCRCDRCRAAAREGRRRRGNSREALLRRNARRREQKRLAR